MTHSSLEVLAISSQVAARVVIKSHYLHRRPPISFAYGLYDHTRLMGVVTFGTPASRPLQKSLCPSSPSLAIELNRLWVDDAMPANTESWFVSRALKSLPGRIVASYADPVHGHAGYIYRALNFYYAGWTDMERKTPRFDYIPIDPSRHPREASRTGCSEKRRRIAKVKYWTVTGNRAERRALEALCPWPKLSWHDQPPPMPESEKP